MRLIIVCVLAVSAVPAFSSTGWTVLAELRPETQVTGVGKTENGNYCYDSIEEEDGVSWLKTVVVDREGNSVTQSREPCQSPLPAAENYFVTVPFPDITESDCTFAGVSKIDTLEDTLWTVMLDSIHGRHENGSMIVPGRDGGCIAVFAPDPDFLWKVYRLSDTGSILMSGSFTMQGGPVTMISSAVETPDSGVLIGGTTDELGMNISAFLIGLDENGTRFLEIKEDLRFHAGLESIQLDDSGMIYLSGYTGFERNDGYFMPPMNSDVFLMKLNPAGEELWTSVLELPLENRPLITEVTENGEILMLVSNFHYENAGEEEFQTLLLYSE